MSSPLLVPEVILLNSLQAIITKYKEEYQSKGDESTIAKLFEGVGFEKYPFKEQLIKLLALNKTKAEEIEENPRTLSLDLLYNAKRDRYPSAYITLPSETPAQMTLGMGQDSDLTLFQYDQEDPAQDQRGAFHNVLTRRFTATYNLVIVSDNANEVVLLYSFFRACLISLMVHFNISGLVNMTLSGQDLQPYSEDMSRILTRAIPIRFEYTTGSFELEGNRLIQDVEANGTPVLV